MPVTKDDVLASLSKVAAPDGTPLPKTGTLSDIVAGEARCSSRSRWTPGRAGVGVGAKRAEERSRRFPGVQSAMVALTAERKGGAAPAARPAAQAGGHALADARVPTGRPHGLARRKAVGVPGVTSIIAVASARAASASRPPRSILRSRSAISA